MAQRRKEEKEEEKEEGEEKNSLIMQIRGARGANMRASSVLHGSFIIRPTLTNDAD